MPSGGPANCIFSSKPVTAFEANAQTAIDRSTRFSQRFARRGATASDGEGAQGLGLRSPTYRSSSDSIVARHLMGQRADGLGVLGHPGLVPLALSLSAVPRVGFDIPTPKIGGFEFTWPDFHYLLTAGDRTSAAMRSPGVALGVHLYDLRLGDKLRVSLLSSFSADASLGAGFRFGTDLRVLLPHASS